MKPNQSPSWCASNSHRELLLGYASCIPAWHPTPELVPKAGPGASNPLPMAARLNSRRASWSWLQVPLQQVNGTEAARPAINAIWFKASTLRSPWKPRWPPGSKSTLPPVTPEWGHAILALPPHRAPGQPGVRRLTKMPEAHHSTTPRVRLWSRIANKTQIYSVSFG